MAKDTPEAEPVDTWEDSISSLIDEAEKSVDEEHEEEHEESPEEEAEKEAEKEPEEEQPETAEEDPEEVEETEEEPADEPDDDLGDGEEEEDNKLTAPEHWAAADREVFDTQSREAQEFLLKRHKEMEGHFTRKNQELSDIQRQYDSIRDALAPYETEFSRSGLDHAGAVRQLAHWHNALKTGGKPAILQLAQTYGIDLDEVDEDVDPTDRKTRAELSEIRNQLARQQQEAQQREQSQLLATIQAFEEAKDEQGKLLHPHFEALKDDITRLFQSGLTDNLDDGYRKALALRPDLAPKPVEKQKPIVDQAERVKKAKRAATGVKSSGAVGKRDKAKMTLEEEIASLIS